MVLNVKGKEYKVKFGYNCFCDTDLLDRTSYLISLMSEGEITTDDEVAALGKIKDLFVCVRDLLFFGFIKNNPVENVQVIGDILDDYREEGTEEEPHGLVELFTALATELTDEGFLRDLMVGTQVETTTNKVELKDHLKPMK